LENIEKFLSSILNSITDHIVVINDIGEILYVNNSWLIFGGDNNCKIESKWVGVNYIEVCDKASAMGDDFGSKASVGIRSVIQQDKPMFYFEYPCHSSDVKRWFMMRVTPFQVDNEFYFVISHQDISERKQAEEEVRKLAKIDGLTGISNRRCFDDFIHEELRRCARLEKTLCVAIIDLDYFKRLNDSYGHQAGDECLVRVGGILKGFTNRPSDLCARYGGDEFVIALGDTSLYQANQLLNRVLKEIVDLNIVSSDYPDKKYLTASIGVAEATPSRYNEGKEILGHADNALYLAKSKGRNRVES
jgi:diguanylate cyclase (GGDEF)-like protein